MTESRHSFTERLEQAERLVLERKRLRRYELSAIMGIGPRQSLELLRALCARHGDWRLLETYEGGHDWVLAGTTEQPR